MDTQFQKKRFLLCAAHDGNAINGIAPVAQELKRRGHEVLILLQQHRTAALNFSQGERLAEVLRGMKVQIDAAVPEELLTMDAVILATSTPLGENLEITTLREARQRNIPAYAVEEVVGGRHNPSWRDHLSWLTALFAPLPEAGFKDCPEVVVGPTVLSRWRSVSVESLAAQARVKLELTNDQPVIYFFPSPSREAPAALHILGRVLAHMREQGRLPSQTVFLLNRHRREMTETARVPGNAGGFHSGLHYIAEVAGLKVFDNSSEYDTLPPSDQRKPLSCFRPPNFLDYMEMLAITANNGAALTFYGTDAQMVAPYLAVAGLFPILWLDPQLGGRMLQQEKQMAKFNLPHLAQPTTDQELITQLSIACAGANERYECCQEMARMYQFPKHEPAVLIVDAILKQLIS